MLPRNLATNVLLPAGIALVVVAVWFWVTGGVARSVLTVTGLALVSAGASVAAEWLIGQARRARRPRARPPRHRKPTV
ncbi:hypothetical protein PV382_17940 [Streptomyces scabiei]|uniref:hypothetical protein n=1 Tax=Streptomyces scabiei TaxID=1930 RepID=UPI000AB6EF1F|nr:hypothetical protein [Streptomyces scabiei]MDX2658298.1 hypothetical protein [Streptomyces scabiei]MDX2870583.1 hypothetical protein [Streptomyces scabiei]MDX2996408.1 hypothetical protein [Streptomyces scabiei]MDX3049881.1 hypothetical protein [Streptomyces scabiei]MDX3174158.1 hypothetical protein [Streptomyces scabiei]